MFEVGTHERGYCLQCIICLFNSADIHSPDTSFTHIQTNTLATSFTLSEAEYQKESFNLMHKFNTTTQFDRNNKQFRGVGAATLKAAS